MADPTPRRKLAPEPLRRAERDELRPLLRAARGALALPTVASLLRAGALVSAAAAVGLVAACGHGEDGDEIKADSVKKGSRDGAGTFARLAASMTAAVDPTTSPTTTPTVEPLEPPTRTAGAPMPIHTVSTGPIGIAPPRPPTTTVATTAPAPTIRRAPGGPMIANTVRSTPPSPPTPTAVPPAVGGKPKNVTPTPATDGAGQLPCPSPNKAPTTT